MSLKRIATKINLDPNPFIAKVLWTPPSQTQLKVWLKDKELLTTSDPSQAQQWWEKNQKPDPWIVGNMDFREELRAIFQLPFFQEISDGYPSPVEKILQKSRTRMRRLRKRQQGNSGRATVGSWKNPGRLVVSIPWSDNPHSAWELLLHEALHSVGFRHGPKMNRALFLCARQRWPMMQDAHDHGYPGHGRRFKTYRLDAILVKLLEAPMKARGYRRNLRLGRAMKPKPPAPASWPLKFRLWGKTKHEFVAAARYEDPHDVRLRLFVEMMTRKGPFEVRTVKEASALVHACFQLEWNVFLEPSLNRLYEKLRHCLLQLGCQVTYNSKFNTWNVTSKEEQVSFKGQLLFQPEQLLTWLRRDVNSASFNCDKVWFKGSTDIDNLKKTFPGVVVWPLGGDEWLLRIPAV